MDDPTPLFDLALVAIVAWAWLGVVVWGERHGRR